MKKKADVLKTIETRRDLSHIREVYETKNVMEVNQRVKGNWEILAVGPSSEKDLDKNVLFVLGRSETMNRLTGRITRAMLIVLFVFVISLTVILFVTDSSLIAKILFRMGIILFLVAFAIVILKRIEIFK